MRTVGPRRLGVGDLAPPIALPDPSGRIVAIDPAAHAATVVVFTSNGCPYALAWHDRIQQVARDYRDHDVLVVQVISNDEVLQPLDSALGMAERAERGEVAGPFLRDASQAVARSFGATATPEIFLIDRAGVVRYHGAPDADYDDPDQRAAWVRDALDEVLANGTVGLPSTPPAGCSLKWRVELLWWAGCPSHERAMSQLVDVLGALERHDVRVRSIEVTSPDQARELGFVGSPSFFVGGMDLFPATDATPALTCRTYQREDGRISPLPTPAQLEERLSAALVRPWELPGWIDFRKQPAPSSD